jgi:hypothetical protein
MSRQNRLYQHRLSEVSGGMWRTTSAPTTTYINNYNIAAEEFKQVLHDLTEPDRDRSEKLGSRDE